MIKFWGYSWKYSSVSKGINSFYFPFDERFFQETRKLCIKQKASVTLKCVCGIRCHLKQVSCIPLELCPSFLSVRVLANEGIFPRIFLGISVEMVLAGLREGYPSNSQEYPSLKPASTISANIPRNIPGDIPPLARAFCQWMAWNLFQ